MCVYPYRKQFFSSSYNSVDFFNVQPPKHAFKLTVIYSCFVQNVSCDFGLVNYRILSALAHWSPIFGETQYLPVLAFPFIKLFQNNHLVAFEIIASVLGKCGGCCPTFKNKHVLLYYVPLNNRGIIDLCQFVDRKS